MSRFASDGKIKAVWCTTIADISAPTTTELGAGTDITTFIAKNGLKLGGSQAMVDNGDISTSFEAEVIGTWKQDIELELFRDSVTADDDAWTLAVWGTNGFLVVRRGLAYSTAWAAAQKCEVYPAQMGQPLMKDTAANENAKFTLKLAVTSTPNVKATVAS